MSDDVPPLELVAQQPDVADLLIDEDEWSQVEFFPGAQLAAVQHMLNEYKAFEQMHRAQHGWFDVYVRRIERLPLLSGAQPVRQLEKTLGLKAGAAPILVASNTVTGRVREGFSLSLGGNITLYGYIRGEGIPMLGASVGRNPDDARLTNAFMKLNARNGLVLVDWLAQLVLVSVSASGQIEVWRP